MRFFCEGSVTYLLLASVIANGLLPRTQTISNFRTSPIDNTKNGFQEISNDSTHQHHIIQTHRTPSTAHGSRRQFIGRESKHLANRSLNRRQTPVQSSRSLNRRDLHLRAMTANEQTRLNQLGGRLGATYSKAMGLFESAKHDYGFHQDKDAKFYTAQVASLAAEL